MRVPKVICETGPQEDMQCCLGRRTIRTPKVCACCASRPCTFDPPTTITYREVKLESGTPKRGNMPMYTYRVVLPEVAGSVEVRINDGYLSPSNYVLDGNNLYFRTRFNMGGIYMVRIYWYPETWDARILRLTEGREAHHEREG